MHRERRPCSGWPSFDVSVERATRSVEYHVAALAYIAGFEFRLCRPDVHADIRHGDRRLCFLDAIQQSVEFLIRFILSATRSERIR